MLPGIYLNFVITNQMISIKYMYLKVMPYRPMLWMVQRFLWPIRCWGFLRRNLLISINNQKIMKQSVKYYQYVCVGMYPCFPNKEKYPHIQSGIMESIFISKLLFFNGGWLFFLTMWLFKGKFSFNFLCFDLGSFHLLWRQTMFWWCFPFVFNVVWTNVIQR